MVDRPLTISVAEIVAERTKPAGAGKTLCKLSTSRWHKRNRGQYLVKNVRLQDGVHIRKLLPSRWHDVSVC